MAQMKTRSSEVFRGFVFFFREKRGIRGRLDLFRAASGLMMNDVSPRMRLYETFAPFLWDRMSSKWNDCVGILLELCKSEIC